MSPVKTEKKPSRIANFFRKPLDAAFGKTPDGHDVFYLWPWHHAGYVLPAGDATAQLRATMHLWLRTALPLFVLYAVLGVHALVSFGSLYIAAYYITLSQQVKRFALTGPEKLELLASDHHEAA